MRHHKLLILSGGAATPYVPTNDMLWGAANNMIWGAANNMMWG